jgi:hypothetical protein
VEAIDEITSPFPTGETRALEWSPWAATPVPPPKPHLCRVGLGQDGVIEVDQQALPAEDRIPPEP